MADWVRQVQDYLGRGGVFEQRIDGFTPRLGQIQMAESVSNTIQFNGKLLAESGTGTGKTFAYLVPALLAKKRILISTATKHLQEQIFYKDLPVVVQQTGANVSCTLLKGRSNYVCKYRLKQAAGEFHRAKLQSDLVRIKQWSARTTTGDLGDVEDIDEASPVWKMVTSTVDNCLGSECPDFHDCFVNQARKKAMQSKVIVINHHLFYSDLVLKNDGFGEILPDSDVVIFDEAHRVPEIASRFFGSLISSYQIRELINDLNSKTLDAVMRKRFSTDCTRLLDAIQALSQQMLLQRRFVFDASQLQSASIVNAIEVLFHALQVLEISVEQQQSEHDVIENAHQRILRMLEVLDRFMHSNDSQMIKWAEAEKGQFRLHLTPLSVRQQSMDMMAKPDTAWVFTSATLAVGDDFSAFKNELGLDEIDANLWPSPYDYGNNALLYLPTNMPDPRANNFVDELVETIVAVTEVSRGHALCLFTSYQMMHSVYERLHDLLRWPFKMQGESSKMQLIEWFMAAKNPVLLATASFWEGVDIKGDQLRCVIIDKLPFVSPTDPVYGRKLQADKEQGKNPFSSRQIPDAVLALKQGVGRLIRSESDTGVIVICDPRLRNSPYGKTFLDSLPEAMPKTTDINMVRGFFQANE